MIISLHTYGSAWKGTKDALLSLTLSTMLNTPGLLVLARAKKFQHDFLFWGTLTTKGYPSPCDLDKLRLAVCPPCHYSLNTRL